MCKSKLILIAVWTALLGLGVGNLEAQTPTTKAPCSAKGVIKAGRKCSCPNGYLYDAATKRCVQMNSWCRKYHAAKSTYDKARKRCKCPGGYTLDTLNKSCVKTGTVKTGEGRIDDSSWSTGSGEFDFESGKNVTNGTGDLSIGGIIFENYWTGAVNWQVVVMADTFQNIKECPATGYANVDDPDGDGFGSPRVAQTGLVYCLKTGAGNFAKVEVLSATYDSEKDWRICTFRYAVRIGGGRTFP